MFIWAGTFFMMPPNLSKVTYNKPALTFSEQADLLIARGVACTDKNKLIESLRHYNYYRLSGYCLAFEQERHCFLPGVTFEDIADAYEFDRKLRKIIMESLELVEIQMRTSIAYLLSSKYGPFAHECIDNLKINEANFKEWQELINQTAENSKELFVKHFRNKYSQFPQLPIWVLVEILSFGSLSHLFSYLKPIDRKELVKTFQIPAPVLTSWLHVFSYLRNICAHHSRLFDRTLSIRPLRNKHSSMQEFPTEKIIFSILAIKTILRAECFPQAVVREWTRKVEDLFAHIPHINDFYDKVGSPLLGERWLDSSYWK